MPIYPVWISVGVLGIFDGADTLDLHEICTSGQAFDLASRSRKIALTKVGNGVQRIMFMIPGEE